jgi:GT2 family glycosyltransferase
MTAGDKAQAEAARPRPSLWRLFAGELPGGVRRLARGHPARGAGESSLYADRDVECASGALLAFRRELLHEVGYLDESVFMYLEDMDFAARVRSAGYRIRYLGTTWVWHDSGHSRRERESGLDALMPMVWLTYVRRYGGACERLAARPLLLTVCAVAALRRLLGAETPRGELLAMWRAISFRPVREPSW